MNFDIRTSLFVMVRKSSVKISLGLCRFLMEDVAEDDDNDCLISSMLVRSMLRRSGVLFRTRAMMIRNSLLLLCDGDKLLVT